jgi:hypothetical protein
MVMMYSAATAMNKADVALTRVSGVAAQNVSAARRSSMAMGMMMRMMMPLAYL